MTAMRSYALQGRAYTFLASHFLHVVHLPLMISSGHRAVDHGIGLHASHKSGCEESCIHPFNIAATRYCIDPCHVLTTVYSSE